MLVEVAKDIWVDPMEIALIEIDGPMYHDRGPRVMLRLKGNAGQKILPNGITIPRVLASMSGRDDFRGDVNIWECQYEKRHTDEVGEIDICTVHENNSKYSVDHGPRRPCLTLAPYMPSDEQP